MYLFSFFGDTQICKLRFVDYIPMYTFTKICKRFTLIHTHSDWFILLRRIFVFWWGGVGIRLDCMSLAGFVFLVPGTGKSHQNSSAGKFDPERAVLNCWLLALFNDIIVYDVTTHAATLPATSPPLQWRWKLILWTNSFKTQYYFRYEKIINY